MQFRKLGYCQYLLSSPSDYTVTKLASHSEGIAMTRVIALAAVPPAIFSSRQIDVNFP
jgi:hypothetical protein